MQTTVRDNSSKDSSYPKAKVVKDTEKLASLCAAGASIVGNNFGTPQEIKHSPDAGGSCL